MRLGVSSISGIAVWLFSGLAVSLKSSETGHLFNPMESAGFLLWGCTNLLFLSRFYLHLHKFASIREKRDVYQRNNMGYIQQ